MDRCLCFLYCKVNLRTKINRDWFLLHFEWDLLLENFFFIVKFIFVPIVIWLDSCLGNKIIIDDRIMDLKWNFFLREAGILLVPLELQCRSLIIFLQLCFYSLIVNGLKWFSSCLLVWRNWLGESWFDRRWWNWALSFVNVNLVLLLWSCADPIFHKLWLDIWGPHLSNWTMSKANSTKHNIRRSSFMISSSLRRLSVRSEGFTTSWCRFDHLRLSVRFYRLSIFDRLSLL